MRVLLVSGKGGVGKTTIAAATAVRAAALGCQTLVLSTDPAHSLAEVLGTQLGSDPVEVGMGLTAAQLDPAAALRRVWGRLQRWLAAALDVTGPDPVLAEEVATLPGAEELLALCEVRDHARAGRHDLVVVDCAPGAETLRLLGVPEALGWWVERLLPVEWRLRRSSRPLVSVPGDPAATRQDVIGGLSRLRSELADVRAVLTDPQVTQVRLVATPEPVVAAETCRLWTSLSLFGYAVDSVVVNRVLPDIRPDLPDDLRWLTGWAATQQRVLAELRRTFAPLPVRTVAQETNGPTGLAALAEVGRCLYGDADPLTSATTPSPVLVEQTADGFALVWRLPLVSAADVELGRRGDDLHIRVGAARRQLSLPSALRRCQVQGAHVSDGQLRVRFTPDPELWPYR